VQRAREVREHGVHDLAVAVEKGEVGVKPAAEFAKAVGQVDQQRLIAEHGSPAAAVKATITRVRTAEGRSQSTAATYGVAASKPTSAGRALSAEDAAHADVDDVLDMFARWCGYASLLDGKVIGPAILTDRWPGVEQDLRIFEQLISDIRACQPKAPGATDRAEARSKTARC
jgi:hypothetical protein